MNTATIHVKIKPEISAKLKRLARKRNLPVGELIRQAVANAYQLELEELPDHQRNAISAYQGGYISIGKLSEEFGVPIIQMRKWLEEHEITQNNAYSDNDVNNA